MEGSSYLGSQVTGGVENAVLLHVYIPRTDRSSDLPFEAVMQEYLTFPYEYFLVLLFGGYCCKVFTSNLRRKITRIKIR
jgi:hypothetical protein